MKLVHTADVHLDSPLLGLSSYDGAPIAELRSATRRAFDNLVGMAISEKADCLLIAGDLFDGSWKDYSTGLFFAKRLGTLREAGIRVVIVRGNHDAESKLVRSLRLPEGVHVLSADAPETVVFEDLGLAVHGQSFARIAETDDIAARYPAALRGLVNVGLLHTALEGRRGHDRYAPTTVARLRDKGYDYWALGHVHRREVVATDPYIVFPGNLQSRQIRESGAKGATLIDAGTVITGVRHVPVDVLRHADIEVDAAGLTTSGLLSAFEARAREVLASVAETDLPFGATRPPLLAARVTVQGRRGDDIARELLLRPDVLKNELRAAAHHVFPDRLWLGEIRAELRDAAHEAPSGVEPAHRTAITDALRAATWGPEPDAVLSRELEDLVAKLPSAAFSDPEADLTGNEALRRDIFADARDLLVSKLSKREGAGS